MSRLCRRLAGGDPDYQWQYKTGTRRARAPALELGMGGHWAGRYGIDDAAFPQALEIDWVRVYQKAP